MNNDILFVIIKKISEVKLPGKKALQKLVYLIEQKGVELGYSYCIHHYGPYSSLLDYSIQSLEMQGAIELKQQGMTSLVTPSSDYYSFIEQKTFESIGSQKWEIVEYVINNFAYRSAKELELITTTDFVAKEFSLTGYNVECNEVVNGVRNIKGDKFSNEEILQAIDDLYKHGYLSQ